MTDRIAEGGLACATYTHARRHPLVLGRIGGWAPPVQLSLAQLAVLAGTLGLLVWTRALWSAGPALVDLVVLGGVPGACTWAVRHARVEGRDALRSLAGMATWAAAPRRGSAGGRPVLPGRRCRLAPATVPVASGPERGD